MSKNNLEKSDVVYLPNKIDYELIVDIIKDYDVYLIELQSKINKHDVNPTYYIVGSDIFDAKNGSEINSYVIATGPLSTCKKIIYDLRFMFEEKGMKVRRYDQDEHWMPLSLVIYPKGNHALMRSIDYIESYGVISTIHSKASAHYAINDNNKLELVEISSNENSEFKD